jgi:hypothetical protein
MAVITTIDDVFVHPQPAGEVTGLHARRVVQEITIAAADSDGSVFFMGELPDDAILDDITLENADIAGGASYSVGIYDVAGTVILAAVFASTLDLSSSVGLPLGPYGDPIRHAMTALAPTDANKKLYELAGHVSKAFPASGETNRKAKYRIGLLAATIGTAAATIVSRIDYRSHF